MNTLETLIARALKIRQRMDRVKIREGALLLLNQDIEEQLAKHFEDRDGRQIIETEAGRVIMTQHTAWQLLPVPFSRYRADFGLEAYQELFEEHTHPLLHGVIVVPTRRALERMSSADDPLGEILREIVAVHKIRHFTVEAADQEDPLVPAGGVHA